MSVAFAPLSFNFPHLLLGDNRVFRGTVAGSVPFTVQGAAGQTANVFQVQNSAGTNLLTVDNNGNLAIAGTANITLNEAVIGNLTLTGNLSVSGTSTLTGAVTMASTFIVTGATTFGTATTGDGLFRHNLTVNNALTVNGEAVFAAGITNAGMISFSSGGPLDGTKYQFGRSNAVPNNMNYNVPGGNTASHIFTLANGTASTAGGTHNLVQINSTWAAEDQFHRGLAVSLTQNGANNQAITGVSITMTKATGVTTLATMNGLFVATPTITGTVTSSFAINIASQTNVNITTPRAIRIGDYGISNALQWTDGGAVHYANAANNIRFADSTNANGIDFNLVPGAGQTIETVSTTTGFIGLQNLTFTPGANHNSVVISPTWTAEAFVHHALNVTPTQNGAASTLCGVFVQHTKATAATTLTDMPCFEVGTPTIVGTVTNYHGLLINSGTVTGSITNAYGINIADQAPLGVGGTTAFAIRIQSQSANATTTRAIEVIGTGVANAIRLGASANIYSSVAQTIRMTDSTDANGLSVVLAASASQTINSVTTTTGTIIFQNQVFTPGALHLAVQVTPTWTSENFSHQALVVSATQNGSNTASLTGISVLMTKATAATTLALMTGININASSVVGTVSSSFALDIGDQANASIITPRGFRTQSGVANAWVVGASALLYDGGAAQTIRFADSTNARGIDFVLTAAGNQSIRSVVTAANVSLKMMDQTFTAGAAHASVSIAPTWVSENFEHDALEILAIQNGANTNILRGIVVSLIKATVATTLAQMDGVFIKTPTITGTVTTNTAIRIQDQTNAGATTTRSIFIEASGVANSIVWGGSALQYANAANNVRFMDSTNAGGIDITLTAAGAQTIGATASAGALMLNGIAGFTNSNVTLGVGATALAITTSSVIVTGDAGTNTIATITGATTSGQVVILSFVDSLVTITDNNTGAANTVNLSAAFTSTSNDTLTLIYNGTSWREVARSVN